MRSEESKPSAHAPETLGGVVEHAPPQRKVFHVHRVAWVVLLISLAASAGGWLISREHAKLGARMRFDEDVFQVSGAVKERMTIYENVLHGAIGLYAASETVQRDEWKAYVESVSVRNRFPGIDALGFVAKVNRADLTGFLSALQESTPVDVQLIPFGAGDELFIIEFVEPEFQYSASIGTDMSVDPARLTVIESARDTGNATITRSIALENGEEGSESGFLMLLPVYQHGVPLNTVAERRANLKGLVYARFLTHELMREVLQGLPTEIALRVVDKNRADDGIVVYTTPFYQPGSDSQFTTEIAVPLEGRTWTLHFSSTPAFDNSASNVGSTMVGLGGVLISLLLFGIAWSLSQTRERAVAIASKMTSALRQANDQMQREITERKRAEQFIKDSEALYHSLVESLPLSVLRKDLEGHCVFANEHFHALVGRPYDEIIGRTEQELLSSQHGQSHHEEDTQVLRKGALVKGVKEIEVGEGNKRLFEIIRTPVRDGAGRIIGLLAIFWDITDERQGAEELKHERFLLRALMDNLPDRIYFKDRDSRFLRVNKAMLAQHDFTDVQRIVGKIDFDLFTEEHARQAYEDEQHILDTGELFTKEERETWPDQPDTWALTTKMPLKDEEGNIVGTFGISRDITYRKRAEEALRRAKDDAETANRTKSQFLANMSHELRTPLNSVIGFAGILRKNKGGNLGAAEVNFLDRIHANGRHLLALINQILDLSKVEARKVELEIVVVRLDELIKETTAQQEGLVKDLPVELAFDIPSQVLPIQTDPDKLKQILINLIGNALKFTEKGSVTVRVITDPNDHRPSQIDVIDTGVGIPEKKMKAVFEAFQQADASTSRKYGGTGLGLTICEALCRLMGYEIKVASTVGEGSTFSVMLKSGRGGVSREDPPSSVVVKAPVVQPSAVPNAELEGKVVLVIDDEPDSRALLKHMLGEFGCRVIEASSGQAGLRIAQERRPDLITLDLMMPRMSGSEVMGVIRGDPELQHIPVVVVSIVSGEHRGQILGTVDLLQKPIVRAELLAALHRNLSTARPRVLVVDDDEDSRSLVQTLLKAEAVEVDAVENGRLGLDHLNRSAYDLVLLDLMMPEMDGFTFLRTLREDSRHQDLRVVVITAKELTRQEVEQLRQDAHDVVRKSEGFERDLKGLLLQLLKPGGRQLRFGEDNAVGDWE